ncbi:hypothetical protein LIER_22232 [Lithospermum erythrorhizon]|uniref:FAF domain-containing protein n=1 Tax=Lithospermum erythrorhizon TaxID=34254 RepID=A0AAV3QU96_LITER
MSPIACQGLQSCLQPRFSETNILIHNLSPPKLNIFSYFSFVEEKTQEKEEKIPHNEVNKCIGICDNPNDNGGKLGGWSLIQTLCNISNKTKQGKTEAEQVYVHPLVKRNSSTLSSKSLEMCTESLGSETGSDISENNDEFASMLMETDNIYGPPRSKPGEKTKKFNRKVEFPPPLTSISGTDGVQVRPHREGGRLVIKAVTLPPSNAYFQAERVDGRLRLSFLKDDEENDINEEETEVLEEEHEAVEDGICNCKYIDDHGEEDDDGNDGFSSSSEDEIKRKNDENPGCEIEVGEFHRLRRCKEGGNRKGMTNCWETYCLAIS